MKLEIMSLGIMLYLYQNPNKKLCHLAAAKELYLKFK